MSGLDLSQVKRLYVTPALRAIGLMEVARINMVTGIGLVESEYRYLVQMNNGPARGFWQMERATHDDMWKNSLPAPCRSRIATGLRTLLHGQKPDADLMVTFPLYGAAMCAAKVFLAPDALPAADDPSGMSWYHKRWYNTPLGAANALGNIADFQAAIRA